MQINELKEKIIKDAQDKREHLIRDAIKKSSHIEQKAIASLHEKARLTRERTTRDLEENKRKVSTTAKQEVRLKIESLKQSLLEEVFSQVKQELISLSSESYELLLAQLLTKIPKEKTSVSIEIEVPHKRKEESLRALKKAGINYDRIIETDIPFGLRMISETFEYDLTIETILSDLARRNKKMVADILFS